MNDELIILTAIEKRIKARIAALREGADDHLLGMYEEGGVDRIRLMLDGEPVGYMSVTATKGSEEPVAYVADSRKAIAYIIGDGLPHLCSILERDIDLISTLGMRFLEDTGEVIPGLGLTKKVKASRTYTRLSVDDSKVETAISRNPNLLPIITKGVLNAPKQDR